MGFGVNSPRSAIYEVGSAGRLVVRISRAEREIRHTNKAVFPLAVGPVMTALRSIF